MLSLKDVAQAIGAELVDCDDPEQIVLSIAPIDRAVAGTVTFIHSRKYEPEVERCQATAVICHPNLRARPHKCALLLHEQPYVAFAKLMQKWFAEDPSWTGVSSKADVDPGAELAEPVSIAAFVSIGRGARIGKRVTLHPGVSIGAGAVIGDDTVIHANVSVYAGCEIGARCIIHSGAVIGSDGFGFASDTRLGEHVKIPQMGIVVVEDDVEIGANTTVDRAVFGQTRIGAGSKIDNLVQIAHNVQVGRGCILVSQVGIAGSTKLGNFVTLAGQVGVVGHIKLGDGVKVGAQSGVIEDLEAGGDYLGSPAMKAADMGRVIAAYVRGPELRKQVRALEKRLEGLEGGRKGQDDGGGA